MKCMKRVAFESDEELDWITVKGNHIPIKKGQDKGDAIADFFDKKKKKKEFKSGGVYKDKEIDPEDLDEDSDFKKNEVISDEDYEKLDAGSEYIEYSRNMTGYLRPNDEGYNLGKRLTIKVKNEYSDVRDQTVKELMYYYDDDGKHVTTMTVEQTDSERYAEYISSEKRLNEDGEFEEIEYTDEEHYKNLKRFTQYYSERGNERERWDKLQKQALKIKNNSSKRDEFYNKEKELKDSLVELNKKESEMEDGDEKDKIKKEIEDKRVEISNLQNDEKYDDVNKLSFNDYYRMKHEMARQYIKDNGDDFRTTGINASKNKGLPFEKMDDYAKYVDDTKKPIFEKFKRIRNKLKKDIEDGNIKSNIKDMDKTSENFTISYQNNVAMNNMLVDRKEKEVGMIDTNKKMYEMLDQTNEKYYEDASGNQTIGSSYWNVIDHIENKVELDKDKMKQFEDELAELKWGTQEYANKLAEKRDYENSVKKSLTDRDRKMLESHKEMVKADKYSKEGIVLLKDDVKFFKSRNKNEYVTPLVEKNIHVYGFPDEKNINEWNKFKKMYDERYDEMNMSERSIIDYNMNKLNPFVSDDVMEHAYNTLKETYTKNSWVNIDVKDRVKAPDYTGSSKIPSNSRNLEIERKMHYQLHASDGRKFKVAGTSYKQGGNWDKSNQSINIFRAKKSTIDWAHNHEMAHSFFDYTLDALDEGGLKWKKKPMQTWKNQCENLDEGVVRDILGKYAGNYLRDYKNNPQNESYKNSLYTEMYSAIKDLKDGKEKGDGNHDPEEGYEKLNQKYPELVKSYEILTGKEEGNLYYESLKIMSNESVTMNSLDEIIRIQYLDKNGKAVDKKDADIVIIKKYDKNGRMVSHQSLFRDEIANESDDDVEWITVKGNHIPIKKGQDKGDAISDFFDKKNKEKSPKIESYKKELKKNLEPSKDIQELQKNVDETVRGRIEDIIKNKTDKVMKVETQGSYVKGTDLPSSGSDMDIFVVFETDTSEDEMQDLGLEIGLETMTKEFAESQGWENFRVFTKDATSKYAEAYFNIGDQEIEIQIVPTRHLTKEQIENKELNGDKISIGMERTPWQTEFMNDNLTEEQKTETRMLKKFMKETGLYDSSVKSQGFSGYSTEVLTYNLGSFEKVVDYFASDFKVGDVIGLPEGTDKSKYHDEKLDKSNSEWKPFHIVDPIDPNRDLVKAFSPKKIARTILTAKYLKENGKAPEKPKSVSLKGLSFDFKSEIDDENTLNSQIQSLERDIIQKMKKLGFNNVKEFEKPKNIVDGFEINPDRTSLEQKVENGRKMNDYTLNIAFDDYYLDTDETVNVRDMSDMKEEIKNKMLDGMKKKGTKYVVSDDGNSVSIYTKKKYTKADDALNALLRGEKIGDVELKGKNNVLKEIKEQNQTVRQSQSYYENTF